MHHDETASAAAAVPATNELRDEEFISADEMCRIFETDLHSGKFAGHEGEWAAYVNRRFAGIGANEEELYLSILREFGSTNIDIIIQPIYEIGSARM